jgi:hypothetical protein
MTIHTDLAGSSRTGSEFYPLHGRYPNGIDRTFRLVALRMDPASVL